MFSSTIKEEAYKLTQLYGNIDVIVYRDDFKEIGSVFSVLSSAVLDYFLGKNRHRFAVARFRGSAVDVDKIVDWKSSKEECEISRDLKHITLGVPCVDKKWCSKHAESLYKTALRAAQEIIDYKTLGSIQQGHDGNMMEHISSIEHICRNKPIYASVGMHGFFFSETDVLRLDKPIDLAYSARQIVKEFSNSYPFGFKRFYTNGNDKVFIDKGWIYIDGKVKSLEEVLVENDISNKHDILVSNMKNNGMASVIAFNCGKTYEFNPTKDIRLEWQQKTVKLIMLFAKNGSLLQKQFLSKCASTPSKIYMLVED